MPDYYVSNGFVINKESKDGDRSSEIDGQAAMRITSKYSELEADEFSEKALEESGIADGLDRADAGLEDSLGLDDETGIDISVSDDIEKGPARIRQYSYSFSGMAAGGEGAFIYDTDKDTLISINLMESGNGDKDYRGDFRKMLENLSVEE